MIGSHWGYEGQTYFRSWILGWDLKAVKERSTWTSNSNALDLSVVSRISEVPQNLPEGQGIQYYFHNLCWLCPFRNSWDRVCSGFHIFQILEYLHIYNEISWRWNSDLSTKIIHILYILYTSGTVFLCICDWTVIHHTSWGIMSIIKKFWIMKHFRFSE